VKKVVSIFCVLLYVVVIAQAQVNYAVSLIPDSLKKNAEAVVRESYTKFTIKDYNTAKLEVHEVITILNEEGNHHLTFQETSSKFETLDEAEVKVYDAFGLKKATYNKKDMTTTAYGDGLVVEGKVTYIQVEAAAYPITIEKNSTIKFNGLFSYPNFYLSIPDESIQNSVFEVEVPASLSVRYKLKNSNRKPTITTADGKELFSWQVKNSTATHLEKHVGDFTNVMPHVVLGPNKFKLDEYEGDMSNWKNFGDWMNRLYEKTSTLSEDRKQFFRDLVKNATSENEKINLLYSYLQKNMRYVSIQLGIGGLRPFPASFVDEKKYGDCKALSNFLKSALDAVGIASNLIIIYRDYEAKAVDNDFPMSNFNHVILAVPQKTDTLWLECTSNTLPFAQLDESTLARKAIMITASGGVVVNTPASNHQRNQLTVTTTIKVNDEGGAVTTSQYTTTGEQRSTLQEIFHDLKEDDKKKNFMRMNSWKQPDNFEISTSSKMQHPYTISCKMDYENIATFKAGSKLFLEPRLYRLFDEDIADNSNRKYDYHFQYPYKITDTTIYQLPAGYKIENLPKNKVMELPFAAYTSTYFFEAAQQTITCVASLAIKERIVKATDYNKLIAFRNMIETDAAEKIVVKKD
jgi:hypothetical protein